VKPKNKRNKARQKHNELTRAGVPRRKNGSKLGLKSRLKLENKGAHNDLEK